MNLKKKYCHILQWKKMGVSLNNIVVNSGV